MPTNDRIIFMALGGAQEVGASCYYLNLGGAHFLLDCGGRRANGMNYTPHFDALLNTPYLQSFRQISRVFISHAHLDHAAALPDFLQLNERAAVYMTDFTWQVTKLQLGNRLSTLAQENISRVAFLQKIPLKNIAVSFHKAGHIPGAMMMLFNFRRKNILYTGDYSTFPTQLVGAAALPDVKIDVLILCGLHARHPNYRTKDAALQKILRQIQNALKRRRIAYCQVNQISKGVELLTLLNKFLPDAEIFVDTQVMAIVHCFEDMHIKVMNARDHPLNLFPSEPCVVISTETPPNFSSCEIINCDFSLHDDFEAVVNFVSRINPELCVVVHSPPDKVFGSNITLEQVLANAPDSRTRFIFPEVCAPFEF